MTLTLFLIVLATSVFLINLKLIKLPSKTWISALLQELKEQTKYSLRLYVVQLFLLFLVTLSVKSLDSSILLLPKTHLYVFIIAWTLTFFVLNDRERITEKVNV